MPAEHLLPDDICLLAQQVVRANTEAGRKVTVAESCTGGLVSAALTEVPGSSAVFERGYVTYANSSKEEMLNVSSDIIETFGAVSIACVWAMAQGALERSGADVAVAISGIAGPGGGTDTKPVGTVVFARAKKSSSDGGQPEGEMRKFDGATRAEIRRQATLCALELLLP
ncbi:CinA family protein [Erythrobacter sp. LQ02-29]|uniref:CinA family protein n=1 Tax=Erythrobacter sp. LQ02-29 TaxID=2920384 RepID=UPI001F4E3605|nr:CinA family protein [Erythrobacter sp. LQ02-29]MCP9223265.1 CinA family protein [Erythrobacter sp. LQ02-29]